MGESSGERLLQACRHEPVVRVERIMGLDQCAKYRLFQMSVEYTLGADNCAPSMWALITAEGLCHPPNFWSLPVEEQFFFVWEALMLAPALPGLNRRTRAAVAIGLVVAASFTWALHETTNAPTCAFFSTLLHRTRRRL